MARRYGPYVITTTYGGSPYHFHTVAASEAEALRIFRKHHPRKQVVSVTPPAFPVEKGKK